jgi:hypothetical protein
MGPHLWVREGVREDTEKSYSSSLRKILQDASRIKTLQVVSAPIFLEVFCDILHRLGGITPFGVFSDAFQSLKLALLQFF